MGELMVLVVVGRIVGLGAYRVSSGGVGPRQSGELGRTLASSAEYKSAPLTILRCMSKL